MKTSERLDRIAASLILAAAELRRLAIDLPNGGATAELVEYTETLLRARIVRLRDEATILRRVND
jgi:hypothetical protein